MNFLIFSSKVYDSITPTICLRFRGSENMVVMDLWVEVLYNYARTNRKGFFLKQLLNFNSFCFILTFHLISVSFQIYSFNYDREIN